MQREEIVAATREPELTSCLRALNPANAAAREFVLTRTRIAVGSDESNDLILRHPTVSRRHAAIDFLGGRYELYDLGSTNGTFVNGRRLTKPAPINEGDEIRFGAATFVFAKIERPASRRWMSIRTMVE